MHANQPEMGGTQLVSRDLRQTIQMPDLREAKVGFAGCLLVALVSFFTTSVTAQVQQSSTRAEVRQCMSHLRGSVSEEAHKAALTDCVFAFDSQLGGPDTWKANADARVSVPYGRSPEEVRAFWAKQYAQPNFNLDWWPTSAEQHSSYVVTSGESRMTYTDTSGKTITRNGHYVTVWHRQKDGTYRFAWDGGE